MMKEKWKNEKGEEHDEGEEEEPVLPNGSSRGLSSDPILC